MDPAYEKLGLFYLGKRYDLAGRRRLDELALYDSRHLTTHAVVVGMTGSGKTGLGIAMIEEAAIDGVPVLAIDPKGDLGNLLLTFPQLAPQDFARWVEPPQSGAGATSRDEFAAREAATWQKGLAEWGQEPSRIAKLREAADFRLYTPGSRTGTPLAVLKSLAPPTDTDPEAVGARSANVAASLLALTGASDITPHNRDQVLIANLLVEAWKSGAVPDLPWLVQQIQRPSLTRIGVLDLDTFYPARERQELALRFNSVLATPGFDTWLTGDPLDISQLLHAPDGRPRVAIVSIAHLGDAERMMVVSLLLNALLEWTRTQTGTSSLRALVYMDEIFGYFPPVASPPSKLPLVTLLKQARAFGVGLMLSTQNPVDLDYKALSNTGTWFLGKLQTERDKARVLDGLEGVTDGLDRQTLDRMLSALRSRVFIMHDVHEQGAVVIETRWTLSYLRGPMGREELRQLVASGSPAAPVAAAQAAKPDLPRPVLPAGVKEFFLTGDDSTVYTPTLYGAARVQYSDAKRGIDAVVDLRMLAPFQHGAVPVDWDSSQPTPHPPAALLPAPSNPAARYGDLRSEALDARQYEEWARDFERWILRSKPLRLFKSPSLKLSSRPDETERDFRIRLQQAAREQRDAAVEKLRASYAPRLARLEEKARRAHESVAREQQQAGQQKLQTAVSLGATLLSAFMGRKPVSLTTLGRATTAARGVSRSAKEAEDVARAETRTQEVEAELKALENELQTEVTALTTQFEDPAAPLDVIDIQAKRGGIDVQLVALAWQPDATPSTPRP
jgi:Helicase HerA, central domain